MAKVKRHTRTVRGRRQRVSSHRRKLQPRRAGRNARHAYRSMKVKHRGDAAAYGSLALAELLAWMTMRGMALALITLGIVALWLGVAARRTAR